MAIDPQQFIRCFSKQFTPVVDNQGNILGCIPAVAAGVQALRGDDGRAYQLGWIAAVAVHVPSGINPRLNGFVPLDLGTNADLALPPTAEQ